MQVASVKIDKKSFDEFQRAIKNFSQGLGMDIQDVAIKQAHLICTDAMTFTPPMRKGGGGGLSVEARKIGEGAISADINSFAIGANKRSAAFLMYRKLGEAAFNNDRSYFDRVINNSSRTLKTVRNSIMIKIANDPNHERAFRKARNLFARTVPQTTDGGLYDKMYSDIKDIHESMKKKYNERNIRKKFNKGTNWMNKYITTDQSVIKKEVDRSIVKVGALKAGWYKAKQRIPNLKGGQVKKPGGSVPSWVNRHSGSNGVCNYSLNDKTVNLSVINLIGNINNVATEAGTQNIVYGNRVKQMPKELEHILAARANKFNKKSK